MYTHQVGLVFCNKLRFKATSKAFAKRRKKRRSDLQNGDGFSSLDQADKGDGVASDQPKVPATTSSQRNTSSTDEPSSLAVNGAFGTATAASWLMSEGLDKAGAAAGVDGFTELPQYEEERRLMKAAFERMSSPGLGILTASSMSNAKMQALMSGGPSLLQQQWGQALSRRYTAGSPAVALEGSVVQVKKNVSASPFAALAGVGSREGVSPIGTSPGEGVSSPGAIPGEGDVGVISSGVVSTTTSWPPPLAKPISASPFAASTKQPLSSSTEASGVVSGGTGKGAAGEVKRDPSRQMGSAAGLHPGASDFLNSVSQAGSMFPLSGSSAPPPMVGQLADIPSMVELELDFDR